MHAKFALPIALLILIHPFASLGSSNAEILPDEWVIEDVPFVSQETPYYCSYASKTMVLNYLGVDVALGELLFLMGAPFSGGYLLIHGSAVSGRFISLMIDSVEFASSLLGVEYEYWYPSNLTDYWGDYWARIKENVSEDRPVIVGVDPYYLPYYSTFNLSEPTGAAHNLVVVGYDGFNAYLLDPYAPFLNQTTGYIAVPIEDFSNSTDSFIRAYEPMREAFGPTGWALSTFSVTGDPTPKPGRIESALMRNMGRLGGFRIFYPSVPAVNLMTMGVRSTFALRGNLEITGHLLSFGLSRGIFEAIRSLLGLYVGIDMLKEQTLALASYFSEQFYTSVNCSQLLAGYPSYQGLSGKMKKISELYSDCVVLTYQYYLIANETANETARACQPYTLFREWVDELTPVLRELGRTQLSILYIASPITIPYTSHLFSCMPL